MRTVVVAFGVLAASVCLPARIGSAGGISDDLEPPTEAERRADEVAARWEQEGAAAVPEMVAAFCHADQLLADRARTTLASFGQAALAPLLRAAADPRCDLDLLFSDLLCRGVGEPELIGMLGAPQLCVVRTGAEALWNLLEARKEHHCAEGIDGLPANALPVVGKLLRTSNGAILDKVLGTITLMGPVAAPLVPDLIPFLGKDDTASYISTMALQAIGQEAAPAVPALRAKLQRRGMRDTQAVASLGAIGAPARPALPDFAPALKAAVPWMCEKSGAHREAPAIAEAIVSASSQIGGPGVEALVPDAAAALVRLRACARDRVGAWMKYFGGFGAYGAAAVPLLRTIAEDPDEKLTTRRETLKAIDAIGIPAKWSAELERLRRAFARKKEVFARRRDDDDEGDIQRPAEAWRDEPAPVTPRAFGLCRQEAGLGPLEEPEAQRQTGPHHWNFESCVENRLCGPDDADYRATMAKCCREYLRPHGGPVPWFCATSGEASAPGH